MEIDKVSYNDLSLFSTEEEYSVFHRLNFTRTIGGKEWLRHFFSTPYSDLKNILATQQILRVILKKEAEWPQGITNGTVMVLEKFYESNIDALPDNPNAMSGLLYRFLHGPDFGIVKFSVTHFSDFARGWQQLFDFFKAEEVPGMLGFYLERAEGLLRYDAVQQLAQMAKDEKMSAAETLRYGHFLLHRYKSQALELIEIYSRLDAWYSMAKAMQTYQLSFPGFVESNTPHIEANALYHILLPVPVPYDVQLHRDSNFLFLTGANMAGKSTFIKAVGTAVFLAHIGMGVPAQSMKLTLFDGLLSNIQVVDNIIKGESYFFNEVQRIKNTILKINDGRKWLVLIDELFKGTNVEDAMKCSTAVIEGLIKIRNSLFILSTHLYEIGEGLKQYPNICFRYFETTVAEDQLQFSYQLKEGISNDRLGYIILKREKVVELLEGL
jgi:DNA mismatch repair ATPase MutS